MKEQRSEDLPRVFTVALLAVILALFAVRNLPWHLDDYDQAKQAFTSYEMIKDGAWLFQHTPTGRVATKPPLAGWISAALYQVLGAGRWEFAWRLPTFTGALLVLITLWRTGTRLFGGNIGGVLAAGMFGLNFFTPRLATLVRTDMLLATFIFFAGWLVLKKVRTDTPWTRAERWLLFALVLGSMLTKGPIGYAFLAPGLLAFWLITRKSETPSRAWAGWWPWLAPLAVFIGWVALGLARDPDFKEQVIFREFLGRFTVGENARHHNFVPGFYILNLLGKALPWGLLLPTVFLLPEVRRAVRTDRPLLWLLCWTVGGLLFMECVPSKRFDRIFPVVAPAALLLAAAGRHVHLTERFYRPLRHTVVGSAVVGALLAVGYSAQKVRSAFHDDARGLVNFGAKVRGLVGEHHDRLAIMNGKDEAMLMYANHARFTSEQEALQQWQAGTIDWLVLSTPDLVKMRPELGAYESREKVPDLPEKANGYVLIQRPAVSPETPSAHP